MLFTVQLRTHPHPTYRSAVTSHSLSRCSCSVCRKTSSHMKSKKKASTHKYVTANSQGNETFFPVHPIKNEGESQPLNSTKCLLKYTNAPFSPNKCWWSGVRDQQHFNGLPWVYFFTIFVRLHFFFAPASRTHMTRTEQTHIDLFNFMSRKSRRRDKKSIFNVVRNRKNMYVRIYWIWVGHIPFPISVQVVLFTLFCWLTSRRRRGKCTHCHQRRGLAHIFNRTNANTKENRVELDE